MDKLFRLQKMFEYAKTNGICRTKQQFASHIGIANSNLSHAFNGDTRYLNDNLLRRINESLNNSFSLEWLLYGTGDMYAQAQATAADTDTTPLPLATSSDTPTIEERHVKNLEDLVETLQAFNKVLQKDNARLERENEALKKGSVLAKNA